MSALAERKATEMAESVTLDEQEIKAILQDPYKVLPDGVYMKITLVELGAVRGKELASQLDDTHRVKNISFFEIKLYYSDGTEFPMPLANKVRVLLQIPEGWDKSDMEAVLVASGANVDFEESIVTIDGADYVVFGTDHFSPYAMIDKLTDEELAAQTAVSVKTGESSELYIIFGEILISAAVILLIALKRRKDYTTIK